MNKTNKCKILVVMLILLVFLLKQVNSEDNEVSITIKNNDNNQIDCTYQPEFNKFKEKYYKSNKPFKLKINSDIIIAPEIEEKDSIISFIYNPNNLTNNDEINIYLIIETDDDPKFSFKRMTVNSGSSDSISSSSFYFGSEQAKTMEIVKESEKYYILLNCNSNPFENVNSPLKEEIQKPHIVPTNMSMIKSDIRNEYGRYFLQTFNPEPLLENKQIHGFKLFIYSNKKYENTVCSIGGEQATNARIEVIINGLDNLENKNFKFKYENKSNNIERPVPFNKNMFYYTVDYESEHYTATHYKYENNKIQLTFDEILMKIQPRADEQTDNNSNTQKYGIKFAQSNKTISFEGTIKESEWSFKYNHTHFCAKLKTITIKEGTSIIGKFMGFPKKDKFLLSTADSNKNKLQGESIFVCIDQGENPGLLKIKNKIHLSEPNIIRNFEISDFKFLHDSHIEVSSIDKDHINDEPSLLLKLSNPTNGLKYNKCDIFFQQQGTWNIQAESKWKSLGNNIWRCYLQEFTVNTKEKAVYGVTYNSIKKDFQLIIPSDNLEKETRIEIYTQSDEKPEDLEFYVEHSNHSQEEIPFNKAHFRLKNTPEKEITDIKKYHEKDNKFKPRPSFFITIGEKVEKITENNYCFVFEEKGTWTIKTTIENKDWEETTINNIEYYKVKVVEFVANNLDTNCSGKIVNGQYQISIGSKDRDLRKPLYIYMNKDEKLDNKAIEFTITREVYVENEIENITVNNFKLQDQNYKFIDLGFGTAPIQTNFIENQPSILLPAIIKINPTSIPHLTHPNKKLETNAQIMPFSDNTLSDDLKAKLDMAFIYDIENTCKSILEQHVETDVKIYLENNYPNNLEPFSIVAIETPLPTIDNTITDDPESILKQINKEDDNFKIIIFGHVDEDFSTNELVLYIRAFISKLDDRLAFKERIKITTNNIDNSTIQSKMESLIFQLLNSLPDKQIIDRQYKTLKTKQVITSKTKSKPTTQALPTKEKKEKVWDQIDIKNFDIVEYKRLHDIYQMNISNGFYCTLQDYSFDPKWQNHLRYSAWYNNYERKIIPNTDPFNSSLYIILTSEHIKNKHNKTFFLIKVFDQPLDLNQAYKRIHDFNINKYAKQTDWKIPTIHELTQIFQLKKYNDSAQNNFESFMPPLADRDKIPFWTSTFKNREKRILWKVVFQFIKKNDKSISEYKLEYEEMDSCGKAFLLPVSIQ